jgi:quinolinate synthase
MAECPEHPECRESILKKINEECSGIKKSLNEKVSIKILTWAIVAILTAIGIVSSITYTAYSRGQDEKQAQIADCQQTTKSLDKSVGIMANDIEHIKISIKKQEKQQERILRILDRIERKSNGHNDGD